MVNKFNTMITMLHLSEISDTILQSKVCGRNLMECKCIVKNSERVI